MKSDVMHSRVQMEAAILEQLVTEVKETVATEVAFTTPRPTETPARSSCLTGTMPLHGATSFIHPH